MATEAGVRDPHTFAIIGAAMAVHTELGCGFLESVYRRALVIELEARGIPFRTEVSFPLKYRERPLLLNYRADLVCFESVVVEIKALKAIGPIELAQAINYLKASGLPRGLILNFGARSLEYRRVVLSMGLRCDGRLSLGQHGV
jgi:GxxExxY protein